MPEHVEKAHGVVSHVLECVRHRLSPVSGRRPQIEGGRVGDPARQPGVAVVEAQDPEALGHEKRAEGVVPADELATQAGNEHDARGRRATRSPRSRARRPRQWRYSTPGCLPAAARGGQTGRRANVRFERVWNAGCDGRPCPARRRRCHGSRPNRARATARDGSTSSATTPTTTTGLALPMAVDLGTTVSFTPDASAARRAPLRRRAHRRRRGRCTSGSTPNAWGGSNHRWARYVAAVVAVVRPASGGAGVVDTTLPLGAGLSSSAALEVALALALGLRHRPGRHGARLPARRAGRHRCGLRGSWTSSPSSAAVGGQRVGHRLLRPVRATGARARRRRDRRGALGRVAHTGGHRLRGSGGPSAMRPRAVSDRSDWPTLPPRAPWRTPCCAAGRATSRASAPGCGTSPTPSHPATCVEAGRLMTESHRSLARDFEVSTPALDTWWRRSATGPACTVPASPAPASGVAWWP